MRVKIIIVSVLVLLATLDVAAQRALKNANRQYERYRFAKAIPMFERAIERDNSVEALWKLGDCYRMINNTIDAEGYYERASNIGELPAMANYQFGLVLKANGRFQAARQQFDLYGSKNQAKRSFANEMMATCDSAIAWLENPTNDEVESADMLNTNMVEFSPVFYENGIIVTTNREVAGDGSAIDPWTGQPYFKLVYIDPETGKADLLDKDVNKEFNIGPGSVSADGNTLYFTKTTKRKSKGASVTVNRLEIFSVQKLSNGSWSDPEPFEYNTKEYSFGHPFITSDGKRLYYISDKKDDNYGGFDIFYSTKNASGWSSPKNVGNVINSQNDEVFPYVSPQGDLYFSSKGHVGVGGLDIFKTTWKNGQWTPIENMRTPINSEQDDFGMVLMSDGVNGYLSSSRNNADGFDDIYTFTLGAEIFVRVNPYERLNGRQMAVENVNVDFYGEGDESPEQFSKMVTSRSNVWMFGKRLDYTIEATKDGYFPVVDSFTTIGIPNNDTIVLNLLMQRKLMEELKLIQLRNIYFDFNKSDILSLAGIELDKLADLMKRYPALSVKIEAHCDCRGGDKYNMRLSDRRAKSAAKYIMSKGIAETRISGEGFGESQLLNRCDDNVKCKEEEHDINRRVELRIRGVIPGAEVMYTE